MPLSIEACLHPLYMQRTRHNSGFQGPERFGASTTPVPGPGEYSVKLELKTPETGKLSSWSRSTTPRMLPDQQDKVSADSSVDSKLSARSHTSRSTWSSSNKSSPPTSARSLPSASFRSITPRFAPDRPTGPPLEEPSSPPKQPRASACFAQRSPRFEQDRKPTAHQKKLLQLEQEKREKQQQRLAEQPNLREVLGGKYRKRSAKERGSPAFRSTSNRLPNLQLEGRDSPRSTQYSPSLDPLPPTKATHHAFKSPTPRFVDAKPSSIPPVGSYDVHTHEDFGFVEKY